MRHLSQIVGSQRRRQNLEEKSRAGMKERKHVGDGKTTARLLIPRLTELLLQLWSVRHAKTGAIHVKDAMATPATIITHGGTPSVGHTFQQGYQDLQRKPTAGLAVRSLTKHEIGKVFESADGKVSVQDLDDKQVDRRDGIQDATPKAIADFLADATNGGSVKYMRNVLLNAPQSGVDIFEHPWPP